MRIIERYSHSVLLIKTYFRFLLTRFSKSDKWILFYHKAKPFMRVGPKLVMTKGETRLKWNMTLFKRMY
jgi:hypothetical protein